MSLKRNILANYVSQIYVALIGIVMVPMYVRYMGAEAYGLVGFFAMLQAWFQLLDMGLTPTMARETARFNGGATDGLSLRRLLRAMEGIFIGVAVLGGTAMMAASGTLAGSWLKVQELPLIEVQHAIMLMAVIVALRWISGLYRGAINGFESQVWLSGFNIVAATARFVLVIPFFMYVGSSPSEFFVYQLVIALLEVVLLVMKTYRLLPEKDMNQHMRWQWGPLRGVLKFSLNIAFTSLVWILATQADKLVLSKMLPLTDYGYFTLAVLAAGGVMVISNPISGALIPRLTKLGASGDDVGLIDLYRNATQLVVVIAVPASLVLALFSDQVLWVWTGDETLVNKVSSVLSLYALGSGISVIGAFPYYLQYAKGDLKLHLIGSLIFVLFFVPTLIFLTSKLGMNGAGWTWLVSNLIYFLLWVPVVSHRFLPGLYWYWLIEDVIYTSAPVILVGWLLHEFMVWPVDRISVGFQLGLVGILFLTISCLSSRKIRTVLLRRINFLGKFN